MSVNSKDEYDMTKVEKLYITISMYLTARLIVNEPFNLHSFDSAWWKLLVVIANNCFDHGRFACSIGEKGNIPGCV